MKKNLLAVSIILFSCVQLLAQPTLTQANSSPVAGDAFIGHFVDTTGLSAGAGGASVTWSFPSLTITSSDTTYYLDCSATPYCDSFQGSNLASYGDQSYNYYESGSNALVNLGYTVNGSITHVTGNGTIMPYPFTYNNSYKDTSTQIQQGTGVFSEYITIDSLVADGYGTLTLPTGTFNNVLRIHSIFLVKDSFNFAGTPFASTYQTESYTWYTTSGFHSPLLYMNYDTTGTGSLYVSNAAYFDNAPGLAVSAIKASQPFLSAYPNPATSDAIHLSFDLGSSSSAVLSITDLLGKIVYTTYWDNITPGNHELTLHANVLSPGMYIIHLSGNAVDLSQKLVVTSR